MSDKIEVKYDLSEPYLERSVFFDMFFVWLISIGVFSSLAALIVAFINYMS